MTGLPRPILRLILVSVFFATCIAGCKEEEEDKVFEPILLEISSLEDIEPITDSLVKPFLYHNIGGFDTLTVQENKEKFIAVVLPAILIVKHRIREDLRKVKDLVLSNNWNGEDSLFYQTQLDRFNADSPFDLIIRMHTHPTSIALAQAVVESGWGTSRFFSEANNLFGIWSYNPNRPRIASKIKSVNVHLRMYEDISGSVMDYFETLARARAYRNFRVASYETSDINKILPHLRSYSERGSEYVDQLMTIINQNNFQRYDHFILDTQYVPPPQE